MDGSPQSGKINNKTTQNQIEIYEEKTAQIITMKTISYKFMLLLQKWSSTMNCTPPELEYHSLTHFGVE